MMNSILVMIVDDDIDERALLCELLTEMNPGIQCISASDGAEALSFLLLTARHPDYIFLDINMARMSGKECLRRIKNNEMLKHIPVIMNSTTRYISDIEETRTLGAAYFMTKSRAIKDIRLSLETIFKQNSDKEAECAMIILE